MYGVRSHDLENIENVAVIASSSIGCRLHSLSHCSDWFEDGHQARNVGRPYSREKRDRDRYSQYEVVT
jgi:hypothetical protein